MNEESINVSFPSENIRCLKCKHGLLINPYRTNCSKYPDGKPYEVYFKGQECPKFEEAIFKKGE